MVLSKYSFFKILNPFLEQSNCIPKPIEVKEDLLNLDLFEELNILGKVILNKPNETKIIEKLVCIQFLYNLKLFYLNFKIYN